MSTGVPQRTPLLCGRRDRVPRSKSGVSQPDPEPEVATITTFHICFPLRPEAGRKQVSQHRRRLNRFLTVLVSHDHDSLICSILRIYKQVNICSATKLAFKFYPFMSRSPTGTKKKSLLSLPLSRTHFKPSTQREKKQSIKNQKLYTSQQQAMELLGATWLLFK